MEFNKIYNEDCLIGIKQIDNDSIDCILTDPPYLYLKNQKLDREFDEDTLFAEFKRVLKPSGFVVLFGRGTSFYRWNYKLSELGFIFKEEIIWNKRYTSSPVNAINRKHETISIFTKKTGIINKVKIDYEEEKQYDISSVINDVNRIKSSLNNPKSLDRIKKFLETNELQYSKKYVGKNNVTISSETINEVYREVQTIRGMEHGINESSIMTVLREHYDSIHPTQKPVKLLERLLAITTKAGDLVLDPFCGSGSTANACINLNRNFITYEIDKEYYEAANKRIKGVLNSKTKDIWESF